MKGIENGNHGKLIRFGQGGGPSSNLMSFPWLPFSIPFFHTKRVENAGGASRTFWEPDPVHSVAGDGVSGKRSGKSVRSKNKSHEM